MTGEVMDFPNTFDEFANEYGFKDKEEVYTNGSELIQVYRVKQWLEHINETTTMIDKSNFSQEQYKSDLQSAYDCGYAQAKNDLGIDCVSRQFMYELGATCIATRNEDGKLIALGAIEELPPATPQQRKGHWIFDGDCLICSKCKKAYSFTGSNFCPNCGADMRGEENGGND